MDTAGKRLVSGRNQRAKERRLTDGPANQNGSGTLDDEADPKKSQWQGQRQEPANPDSRPHPGTQHPIACGEVVTPVEAGQGEDDREQDGNEMPDDPPALEATN